METGIVVGWMAPGRLYFKSPSNDYQPTWLAELVCSPGGGPPSSPTG
jgi:hypothetical protein